MGLRELKMARTRQLIADKAFELFVERGFDQTTVEQIAAAAEVGPRTLYRYYPTKEALIVKFVEAHLLVAVERLREQPDDAPLSEALYALIDSVITTTMENADRVLAIYEMAGRAPGIQAQFSEVWKRWCDSVSDEVARRYKGRSPELAARLAAASANVVIDVSIRTWAESGGTANIRRVVNRSLELIRAGDVPIAEPAVKR
ncbi:AcrR family transcriptional regulator [Kibdelosporangium banguiense]|uniref:AcrR family transcriptional regulator n=1 Tax=Kibdelosporangium banguiense TaxID=1365924 RepID=A0ABS4U044_9PSEU|nr:TetR family transcriptional regulator [Kibdelosporangium banguiense]MBP2330022.1 AcrR family transcriptional regulator [Kibdelosporangium banguiense]